MEPASSWMLVRFTNRCAATGTQSVLLHESTIFLARQSPNLTPLTLGGGGPLLLRWHGVRRREPTRETRGGVDQTGAGGQSGVVVEPGRGRGGHLGETAGRSLSLLPSEGEERLEGGTPGLRPLPQARAIPRGPRGTGWGGRTHPDSAHPGWPCPQHRDQTVGVGGAENKEARPGGAGRGFFGGEPLFRQGNSFQKARREAPATQRQHGPPSSAWRASLLARRDARAGQQQAPRGLECRAHCNQLREPASRTHPAAQRGTPPPSSPTAPFLSRWSLDTGPTAPCQAGAIKPTWP